MQRTGSRRPSAARTVRPRRGRATPAALTGALLAALLSASFACPAAAAAPPVVWSAARVGRLRGQVVFDVARPPLAATVVLPVPGASAGSLPGDALRVAEAGISGTVAVTGGGRTATLPAVLLRAQALTGALALTYGEQSLDLPPSGKATVVLRLPGQAPQSRTLAFGVRPGAPPAAPPPTPRQAEFVRELNAFRSEAGMPPVRLSAALTAAAAAHAAFVSGHRARYRTGVSVHDEPLAWSRVAGWTGQYSGNRDQGYGSATGGGAEVMSSGNPDPVAFLVWETVFHRDILLDPSVLAAGAAYVGGQFVMDLSSPGGVAAPNEIWPPAGAAGVPTTFGGEWPSPLVPFAGARFPAGTPVTWRDYGAAAGTGVVSPRFTLQEEPTGAVVPARLLSQQNWTARRAAATGVRLGTALALVPDAPLKPHTLYLARVSGTLAAPGRPSAAFDRSWRFTTGGESVPPPPGFARPVLPSAGTSPASTLLTRPVAPPGTGTAAPGQTSGGTAPAAGPAHVSPPPATRPPLNVPGRLAELRTRIAGVRGPRFTDLWKARWAAPAIEALAAAGVIHGIGSHMFDPQGTLTRAQMAVALSNLVPSSQRAAVAGALPAWSVPAVREVAAEGWMGAPGAPFRPSQIVSRSGAVEALTRLMGWGALAERYAASGGAWPHGLTAAELPRGPLRADLLWAAHVRLLHGVDGRVAPRQPLTRAQFAVLLYRLLQSAAA